MATRPLRRVASKPSELLHQSAYPADSSRTEYPELPNMDDDELHVQANHDERSWDDHQSQVDPPH
eukprot:CAMPEP_0116575942 /NCGR_PEP_ID=MMETSP0397-20121206/20232_1 /TAXON_ID=216820 /ORGANISM="Cyclophora tenuis, Strain ECT3854" /LENGTH=64 /DNA_ID=CAMNT_0004104879 /DNA_START=89 /DNA_END=283 /DNA_ORIENTATION=-